MNKSSLLDHFFFMVNREQNNTTRRNMKMEEYKQMNIKKILYEIDGRTEIL